MTASWLVSLILLGGGSMAPMRAACAGNVGSAGAASCGPQIILYVSLPLGSRGSSSLPRYGLRIGEFRKRPTTPQLVPIAPTPRELIDLQIEGHSDVRIAFGRRLVWNVTRQAFGPQYTQAVLTIVVPIKGIRLSDAVSQHPWDPGTSGMSALAGNPIPRRPVDGESLAILNVAISSHWTPTDGWAAHTQLRPTIQFGNIQAALAPQSAETR
jgi:hypothetical protein